MTLSPCFAACSRSPRPPHGAPRRPRRRARGARAPPLVPRRARSGGLGGAGRHSRPRCSRAVGRPCGLRQGRAAQSRCRCRTFTGLADGKMPRVATDAAGLVTVAHRRPLHGGPRARVRIDARGVPRGRRHCDDRERRRVRPGRAHAVYRRAASSALDGQRTSTPRPDRPGQQLSARSSTLNVDSTTDTVSGTVARAAGMSAGGDTHAARCSAPPAPAPARGAPRRRRPVSLEEHLDSTGRSTQPPT